jgi:hypothetical protein
VYSQKKKLLSKWYINKCFGLKNCCFINGIYSIGRNKQSCLVFSKSVWYIVFIYCYEILLFIYCYEILLLDNVYCCMSVWYKCLVYSCYLKGNL